MNILSIGGSDPSSGAGIQRDVRAAQALGAHCLTAVTALTAQNTSSYSSTHPVPPAAVRSQIESVLSDFEVGAVKVSMVYDRAVMAAVCRALSRVRAPVVVDPVMVSTTGGALLKRGEAGAYRKKIVPLADVITPNVDEAASLAGAGSPEEMAGRIRSMGAGSVVITGVPSGGRVCDHVYSKEGTRRICGRRSAGQSRGGGCAHSTAIAVALARGLGVGDAAAFAARHARGAIAGAGRVGRGLPVAGGAADPVIGRLAPAISSVAAMDGMQKIIPECQTNFVYSRRAPRSLADIAGLSGRIVRAGGGAVVAGQVEYGGSKHVATAVLEASRRFPGVRSAANIRCGKDTLAALRACGMSARRYDRARQPRSARSSVAWGVGVALRGARAAPDAVYHEGGRGKEPMIIVFGATPRQVAAKIRRILGAI